MGLLQDALSVTQGVSLYTEASFLSIPPPFWSVVSQRAPARLSLAAL